MPKNETQPNRPRLRPSSASANLQTHPVHTTGLYDNFHVLASRPHTSVATVRDGISLRPKTSGPRSWGRSNATSNPPSSENLSRRLTLTGVEGTVDTEAAARRHTAQQTDHLALLKVKIEEKISISVLDELKQAFNLADTEGQGKLDFLQFKSVLKEELQISASKESQIDALFQKIDCLSHGAITWDEFCTYMQLEYAELEDSYLRTKQVSFILPAVTTALPHRDPVLRITDVPDGSFMACSRDGIFSFWTAGMTLKRTKNIFPVEQSHRVKSKWITDFVIMPHYNKIIVSTGDREIKFYELSSFEPYCQISGFETVPLQLDYSFIGNDECLIIFGDKEGCVNILWIASAGECLRMWKKAVKSEDIASIGLDQIVLSGKVKFIRWKVHGDWVQQIKYYHELRQIISCSNHESSALVIGCTLGSTHVEHELREIRESQLNGHRAKSKPHCWMYPKLRSDMDESKFQIYKGVKCFDFSKFKNVVVTGGMDRLVRIWNPYVCTKPVGKLRGHSSPISYIFIADDDNRIFSISTDRCIRIWDIQDQNCLLTVRSKSHCIRGDIQSCFYSNLSKTLSIATDQMNGLALKLKGCQQVDVPLTHNESIHAVVFNPNFKQLITCSDGSIVKLWDLETGAEVFEFSDAHDGYAITCMTLDSTGRRLITGGRDGRVKVWNYNNGQCLKTLTRESNPNEICAVTYVELNRNLYIVAVGWDQRVNIYVDTYDDPHCLHYPLENWADDLNNGHTEDILSVAHCPPNMLATSSYDGEVIVWNMVSGHIFCHLHAPEEPNYKQESIYETEMSINEVLFLRTRADNKNGACLVASGPRGYVNFWNVFGGGSLLAQISSPSSTSPGTFITSMKTNEENSRLVAADSCGFISVWNIQNYCLTGPEKSSPPLLRRWRGHLDNVTCIVLVESHKLLITSSLDCTVRVWTYQGEYVGVFGQPDTWDLYNPSSFEHPMVPFDVLIDPLSLPTHFLIQDKQNLNDILFGEEPHEEHSSNKQETETLYGTKCRQQTDEELSSSSVTTSLGYKLPYVIDNEAISEMLEDAKFKNGTGKRLRHERTRPVKVDHGGPSQYQMLNCYNLDATPKPESPRHLKRNHDDPFNFFGTDLVKTKD